ncbi:MULTISPECIES: ATP-dependent RNA helicase HrpA [unclassified Photobacterium]|uniref:ATP-dependent RNA helicase HrpA n=1 Tax=unclassified Photobacterium TaxID=2628852 RepID=UPI000D16F540|nr:MULTISPECIES: ATP-dependent RNA helicase HrpA [unclassified Photobacterium]PSV27414.1 ATP-dependent RNA helicase HrpA [Photobacterium sp. GB-56]PSV31612.1 ATP-dependent RNA helicase HrpA [Photobacterium sp. GB-210]PSV41551.1 ATP-dependent RNA helicase HrpA [Photobacterium sp. GB-36]PSV53648.1 ATP-dependent RNA helicase HrpA [Photobacterium sp. GB-1]PSW72598.1 ATP-dependent RNA helicase HrpA [Photobacterium sp. GB-50]
MSQSNQTQADVLNNEKTLKSAIKDCMMRDRFRLHKRVQGASRIKNEKSKHAVFDEIALEIAKSMQTVERRRTQRPKIIYPAQLPVSQKKDDIAEAILNNQVVIVAGETGSGKTTQLPKICLEIGRGTHGMIGHTQPRRLAARSVASRIAEEMECEMGSHVGYKVRFNDQVSEHSHVKLMTDGILLAEIQHDRFLSQYDTIIIDEAHERSLNIDFIMGYLRELLPKRPDLKVIITSATIDPERFSKHFNNAPIIEVSGRTYPVEVRYRPVVEDGDDTDRDQLDAIFDAVDELCDEGEGDILIFLNGEREIRDTADALEKRKLRHTEILPLYARLSAGEQNRVFQSHSGRRIVLSTNVAETSLTVPGIKYVIDPGTARISRYSYRTKVQRLPIEAISQASANQRMGRCGRVQEGICIRLYSEEDFLSRPEFTDPEILRTNLASVILQMTAIGLGDIQAFPFVEAPDNRNIQDGIRLLEELGAINSKATDPRKRLSPMGRQLARLPIDPRLARMVLEAPKHGALREVMIIASALSIQDPRERPSDKQQQSDEKHRRFNDKDSDFVAFVNLWNYVQEQQKELSSNQFRRLCKKEYLNYLRIREWQDIYFQVNQVIKELELKMNGNEASYDSIHISLLSGLLSHIGMKDQEKNEYQGARNARFNIFPGSGIFKKQPKWVMVAELVETSRLWGRIGAKIQPEWVEPLAGHLIKRSYSEPHWEKKSAAVHAFEKVTLYGIPVVAKRKVNYGNIDPTLSREIFIRSALVEGDWDTRHKFYQQNRKLLREVEELEHKSRRRDILIDDDELFNFYDQRIDLKVTSGRHFDSWWKKASKEDPELLNFEREMLFRGDASHVTDLDYPNFWHQGNLKLKLSYQFEPGEDNDGVTVHVPLAILNQVQPDGFDWQIPGLRHELVVALIKSLPKPLRRNFVPAPNYADAFLARVKPMEAPLLDSLEKELKRMSGVTIVREDWNLDQIPDHLKITYRAVDHRNRKLRESKDIYGLKDNLKEKVQETLSQVADDDIEQDGLKTWSFGTLPERYQQKRGGFEVKAYPALVDNKDSVGIKLFETEEQQNNAMQAGQRRLILLNVPSPIKYLHSNLPNKSKLGLYFNPYGRVLDLIDDCIACGVDKLIEEKGGLAWQPESFEALKEFVRAELGDTVVDIAKQVEEILTTAFNISKRLKGRIDLSMAFAMSDIKAQIESLIFKGFATECGWKRLPDILRYMRAIERRMEKLPIDPNKDRVHILKIESVVNEYKELLNKIPKGQPVPDKVKEIRWMIEELRVSYFAQQLGTPYPVSDKRVRNAINEC